MNIQPVITHNTMRQNRMGFMFPQNFSEAQTIAKTMLDSSCIPDWHYNQKNPIASVMMCLQKGIEVGLSPTEAVQKICRINGVLAIWGDAALGLCKIAPDYEYCHETYDEATETATCEVKRKGEPKSVIRTFSKKDAEVAELWAKVHKRKSKEGKLYEVKSVWCYHPKRMLQMRARGFALRDCFPHVLLGLYLVEEFAGREEIDISPTEQKLIVLDSKNPISQTGIATKNVAESLKLKLKSKNTADIAECETIEDVPLLFKSSDAFTVEPLMNGQTKENLLILYGSCDEFQERIDNWLSRKGIHNLQDLTENHAQKIISQLEKETPKAREYWDDYLSKRQPSERAESAV
jgi:hypothetical protein